MGAAIFIIIYTMLSSSYIPALFSTVLCVGCRESGKKCLVHCKKGVSRSSSTVIAYIMKEYGWALDKAVDHVKKRRNCITPNR